MNQQIIVNTPVNSGLGDSLKIAFDKVNENFTEVYDAVSGLSATTVITNTSELVNDGEDGINPFITAQALTNIPTSAITGLDSALSSINSALSSLNSSVLVLQSQVTTLQSDVIYINNQILGIQSQIALQNAIIADLQDQINQINNP